MAEKELGRICPLLNQIGTRSVEQQKFLENLHQLHDRIIHAIDADFTNFTKQFLAVEFSGEEILLLDTEEKIFSAIQDLKQKATDLMREAPPSKTRILWVDLERPKKIQIIGNCYFETGKTENGNRLFMVIPPGSVWHIFKAANLFVLENSNGYTIASSRNYFPADGIACDEVD